MRTDIAKGIPRDVAIASAVKRGATYQAIGDQTVSHNVPPAFAEPRRHGPFHPHQIAPGTSADPPGAAP